MKQVPTCNFAFRVLASSTLLGRRGRPTRLDFDLANQRHMGQTRSARPRDVPCRRGGALDPGDMPRSSQSSPGERPIAAPARYRSQPRLGVVADAPRRSCRSGSPSHRGRFAVCRRTGPVSRHGARFSAPPRPGSWPPSSHRHRGRTGGPRNRRLPVATVGTFNARTTATPARSGHSRSSRRG